MIQVNKTALRSVACLFMLALAGCAKLPSFTISAREQARAEQDGFDRQARQMETEGVHGVFLPTRWSHGECHWTQEPKIAVCRTRGRSQGAKAWRPLMMAYQREADGTWTSLGQRSLLGN
jgi:hypothetical protein